MVVDFPQRYSTVMVQCLPTHPSEPCLSRDLVVNIQGTLSPSLCTLVSAVIGEKALLYYLWDHVLLIVWKLKTNRFVSYSSSSMLYSMQQFKRIRKIEKLECFVCFMPYENASLLEKWQYSFSLLRIGFGVLSLCSHSVILPTNNNRTDSIIIRYSAFFKPLSLLHDRNVCGCRPVQATFPKNSFLCWCVDQD